MNFIASLSARITASLALGLTIILLISWGFIQDHVSADIYDLSRHVHEGALALEAANAAGPLWNLDRTQLQSMVDNIAKDEDIVYAGITNFSDGNLIVETGVMPRVKGKNISVLIHPINYQTDEKLEELGQLSIVLDHAALDARVSRITHNIAYIIGGLFLLLMLAIYMVTRYMVRPVTQLAGQLLHVAKDGEGRKAPTELIQSTTVEVKELVQALDYFQEAQNSYQDNLIKAKNEAEEANLSKSEFLANMSHELRTPLNSIIGITKILRDDAPMDSDEREMASIVYKSGVNLLDIVNDILDLSKIESKRIELEHRAFDLKPTVYHIVETLAPMASRRGISLNSRFERMAQMPYIKGDSLRVSRILMNLAGNAIKYTEQGHVDIVIDHKNLGNNKIEIICSVIDTGIGIPADRLDAVFQKFTQADATTTRKFGGTGLGLTITKDLVELMGGTISVESREGEGSTFTVIIPFEIAEEVEDFSDALQLGPHDASMFGERVLVQKARVLVAEDHLLNQQLVKKLLSRLGFTDYDIAENGALAVNAFKERHYDMILMDCHMPVMNGYQAMEAIRAAERGTGTHIPILALTADAMVGTREKCHAAGADGYVSKPIDTEHFEILLSRWFVLSKKDADGLVRKNEDVVILDLANLNDYADTREELVEFCSQLCRSTERDLAQLNACCVDGESQEWVEAAHKIKGTAALTGVSRFFRLAKEAQELTSATGVQRRSYFDNLCIAYQEVKEAMQREGLLKN